MTPTRKSAPPERGSRSKKTSFVGTKNLKKSTGFQPYCQCHTEPILSCIQAFQSSSPSALDYMQYPILAKHWPSLPNGELVEVANQSENLDPDTEPISVLRLRRQEDTK